MWGLGAPMTELWMDNWCILAGAENANAAYAWINFICDPEISLKDLEYHGYNTGIMGVQEEAEAAGPPRSSTSCSSRRGQVATMEPGAVNSAHGRLVRSGTRRRPPREPDPRVTAIAEGGVGAGAKRPRRRAPRFALAMPGMAAVHPLLRRPGRCSSSATRFGYKPVFFRDDRDGSAVASTDTWRRFPARSGPTFRSTLQISIVGTLLCLLIAFPFAYWLAVRWPPRWRGLLLGLVIVPFWTNFLVRTLGWRILLQPNGLGVGVLQDLGI